MKTKQLVFVLIFSILLILGCGKKESQTYPNQLKPGTPEYYLNQGLFYLNAGNFKLAETRLMQALEKDPNIVSAINGLGIVYLNRREFDRASQQFRRVIQLNPKFYDAYNYMGVIFTETGKYELAKENFLIAANSEKYRTPENAFANLAALEMNHNKLDSALRYVGKGLEKNKGFAPLYNVKGIIFEKREDYKKAIFYYEKALSLLTTDDVSYLINMARVYAKMGRENKALDILEKALPKAYSRQLKDQIQAMIKEVEKQKQKK
jgi:Tfp pilus assembly protein PilF